MVPQNHAAATGGRASHDQKSAMASSSDRLRGAGEGAAHLRDLTVAAEPKEMAELEGAIGPKGHRVFFGALDPGKLGFSERAIRKLPAARTMLPEGDFRDWTEIDTWASNIAHDLAQ